MDDVFDRLRRWLAAELRLDPATITPASRLADLIDPSAGDSLDYVELVLGLEEAFGSIDVDEATLREMTVGDLARYLADRG